MEQEKFFKTIEEFISNYIDNDFVKLIIQLRNDLGNSDFFQLMLNNISDQMLAEYQIDTSVKNYLNKRSLDSRRSITNRNFISNIFSQNKYLLDYLYCLLKQNYAQHVNIKEFCDNVQVILSKDIGQYGLEKIVLTEIIYNMIFSNNITLCLHYLSNVYMYKIHNSGLDYVDYYNELKFLIEYYDRFSDKQENASGLRPIIINLFKVVSTSKSEYHYLGFELIEKLFNSLEGTKNSIDKLICNIDFKDTLCNYVIYNFSLNLKYFKYFHKIKLIDISSYQHYTGRITSGVISTNYINKCFIALSNSCEQEKIIDYLIQQGVNFNSKDNKIPLLEYLLLSCNLDLLLILEEKEIITNEDLLKMSSLPKFNILNEAHVLCGILNYLEEDEKQILYRNNCLDNVIESCDYDSFVYFIEDNMGINNINQFFRNLTKNTLHSHEIFEYIIQNCRAIFDVFLNQYNGNIDGNEVAKAIFDHNVEFIDNFVRKTARNISYARIQGLLTKLNECSKVIGEINITINSNIDFALLDIFISHWYLFNRNQQEIIYEVFINLLNVNVEIINNLITKKQNEFISSFRFNNFQTGRSFCVTTIDDLISNIVISCQFNGRPFTIDDLFREYNYIQHGFKNLFNIDKYELNKRIDFFRNYYKKKQEEEKIRKDIVNTFLKEEIDFEKSISSLRTYIRDINDMIIIIEFLTDLKSRIDYFTYGEDIFNFFNELEFNSFIEGLEKFKEKQYRNITFFDDKIKEVKTIKCKYKNLSNLEIEELNKLKSALDGFNCYISNIESVFKEKILGIFNKKLSYLSFEFNREQNNLQILEENLLVKIQGEYGKDNLKILMKELRSNKRVELKFVIVEEDSFNDLSKKEINEKIIKQKLVMKQMQRKVESKQEKIENLEIQEMQKERRIKQEQYKENKRVLMKSKIRPTKDVIKEFGRTDKFETKHLTVGGKEYRKTILLNSLIDLFEMEKYHNYDYKYIDCLFNIVVENYNQYLIEKKYEDESIMYYKKIKFFERIKSRISDEISKIEKEGDKNLEVRKERYKRLLSRVGYARNNFVYHNYIENEIERNNNEVILQQKRVKLLSKIKQYKENKDKLKTNQKRFDKIRNAYFLEMYQDVMDLNENLRNLSRECTDESPCDRRNAVIGELQDRDITRIIYNNFSGIRNRVIHGDNSIDEQTFEYFIKTIEEELIGAQKEMDNLAAGTNFCVIA